MRVYFMEFFRSACQNFLIEYYVVDKLPKYVIQTKKHFLLLMYKIKSNNNIKKNSKATLKNVQDDNRAVS